MENGAANEVHKMEIAGEPEIGFRIDLSWRQWVSALFHGRIDMRVSVATMRGMIAEVDRLTAQLKAPNE